MTTESYIWISVLLPYTNGTCVSCVLYVQLNDTFINQISLRFSVWSDLLRENGIRPTEHVT